MGLSLDTRSTGSWAGAVLLLALGGGLFEVFRRRFQRQWGQVQEEIELLIKRGEAQA
ncbi:hypothetical protein D3C87_1974560 [compost metagenome]